MRQDVCVSAVVSCHCQGEVEQIAMMKPKGQTEHDEGMLEYLEDIIGSCRLKEPINILCRRVELLNEQRGEKVQQYLTEHAAVSMCSYTAETFTPRGSLRRFTLFTLA